ncbi:hypothetical protein NHX12_005971 [Muraenolepis orangiensis]|uniref:Uncharacterized protein n=1 Tax=Muraenolepis orangiensis TaxID=630683 RepID=A0A9Q0IAU0_9TELE|nr:hypothetical protein NHX12_005971 [Muraenolepis orangiensis]
MPSVQPMVQPVGTCGEASSRWWAGGTVWRGVQPVVGRWEHVESRPAGGGPGVTCGEASSRWWAGGNVWRGV